MPPGGPPPPPPRLIPQEPPWINASYYPSWRIYRGEKPSSLDLERTTHVFYAFAGVRADGNIYNLDEWADLQMQVDGSNGCLAACAALKKSKPQLRLILSIGGASSSDTFAEVASSSVSRESFARSTRQFIDQIGFDGIDIDWEHPKNEIEGRDFLLLLQACRQHLPAPQYLLTSALPTGEWCLRNIDMYNASQVLDLINLMCYDFSGPWTELSGHHAQLYAPKNPHDAVGKHSCTAAIEYLLNRGVLSRKMLFGIPAYGRSFLNTNGIGQKFDSHSGGSDGTIEYKDLPPRGGVEYVDWSVVAAYSVGGDSGFVTYDNPATVAAKAQFVKQMGLAGLFYWTGVGDVEDKQSERSLVAAGWNALHADIPTR